jgi:crotonobetainyl-CoA:carnitine CoA-transferase CaiB-like acyl-CoA transferase
MSQSPNPPLKNIRVLDLTRVLAGPWCTQMLADMGAEVLKIESPDGGDDARKIPPFFANPGASDPSGEPGLSAFFVACNRGKKSVVVDISTEEGQAALHELVKSCDVVVENFKVGGLAKHRLDYASLSAINPGIIYCSITGYGQNGPLAAQPGYDILFQGISGAMSTCGLPDSEPGGGPMRTVVPYTDIMTGLYACNGILAALLHRQSTGQGQYIDLALLDVAIAANSYIGSGYLASNRSQGRIGNSGVAASPSGVYPCLDGHVIIQCNHRHWTRFCSALKHEEWTADARFLTIRSRIENAKALDDLIAAVTRNFTRKDLVSLVAGAGAPCVPVNSIAEAFAEPQVLHRELVVNVPLSNGQSVPVVRNPIRFSGIRYEFAAPPEYGAHTREVVGS